VNGSMISIERFDDHASVAAAAAAAVASALAGDGPRTFIATGGTTPGGAYDRLSAMDLDWSNITVAPSDERFVDPDDEASNEGLLRRRLLVGRAARAKLLPLKGDGPTADADAAAADDRLRRAPPGAAVLLGMGADGHIASLFPADPDLAARLDPDGEALCVGVALSSEPPYLPRISLTVRPLLATRLIVVLVTGETKRAVIERIFTDTSYAPPAGAVLRQTRTPLRILWAP